MTLRNFSTLVTGAALMFGFVCCLLIQVAAQGVEGQKMNATMLRLPPLLKRSFPSYITLDA
jgi:hypothetical protein